MTSSQLSNYLRANRKRLGLSQDEVAFLLGTQSGTKVSRYESSACEPKLRTVLAFEAIFQQPIREIFGGIYQEVANEVATRAKALTNRTSEGKPKRRADYKRQILTNIATREFNQIQNPS